MSEIINVFRESMYIDFYHRQINLPRKTTLRGIGKRIRYLSKLLKDPHKDVPGVAAVLLSNEIRSLKVEYRQAADTLEKDKIKRAHQLTSLLLDAKLQDITERELEQLLRYPLWLYSDKLQRELKKRKAARKYEWMRGKHVKR